MRWKVGASMFFDSHCHLNSEELIEDIDEVVCDAINSGVTQMMVVGFDYPSCMKLVDTIKRFEGLYGAVGVFPCEVANTTEEQYQDIVSLFSSPLIKAVGEIGLDYYWEKDEEKRALQREWFIRQIELANEKQLPIIVHSREASEDTYKILSEHKPLFGCVLHCYSGSVEMMEKYVEMGFYISLAGPVTFKNAITPKEVAAMVPLDKLLIETDSPYLSPHPYRGCVNSPQNVVLVAKEIARIRRMTTKEIGEVTSANACKLFHVKQND